MADESARHRLFHTLEQLLGIEEAASLMEHLHPRRWDELATKADLDGLATKADMAAVGAEMATKAEMTALRAEMATKMTALRAEMATKAEMTAGFEGMGHRIEACEQRVMATVRGEMGALVTSQTRTIVFALVGAISANALLVLAAVRLA